MPQPVEKLLTAQGRPYTLKLAVGKHDRPFSTHHMLLSCAFKSKVINWIFQFIEKSKLFCIVSAPQVGYFSCTSVRICNSSDALHWFSSLQSFNSSPGHSQGNKLIRTMSTGRSCKKGMPLWYQVPVSYFCCEKNEYFLPTCNKLHYYSTVMFSDYETIKLWSVIVRKEENYICMKMKYWIKYMKLKGMKCVHSLGY